MPRRTESKVAVGARLLKWRGQALLLGGAALLLYLILASLLATFQVYRIDKEIVKFRREILVLEEKNQELKNLIAYLKTDSFKEREARRKLNYRKPGEKVLVVPNLAALTPEMTEGGGAAETPELKELPNYLKWWRYFFNK